MKATRTLVYLLSIGLAAAQHPGWLPEVHPPLTTWECTKHGGCFPKGTSLVLDSLNHPVYQVHHPQYNCSLASGLPNATACPNEVACAENCVMQGVSDYTAHGVWTEGGTMTVKMLEPKTHEPYNSRFYLLSEDQAVYEMFHLVGQELSFEIDVSKLPCGMNSALYMSEMAEDGGRSVLNTGGAYYGTGYCDAQCYTTPFINGVGNIHGYGACCNELDIWEANSRATQLAPHTCNVTGLYECTGAACSSTGVCDQSGCTYNPYRLGNENYYGLHDLVDTTKPFTVVTQFIPSETHGFGQQPQLQEIRRLYVQNGKVIPNAPTHISSLPASQNFIDDEYCEASGATRFMDLGALKGTGESLDRGMVLAFSLWWDPTGYMDWLDADGAGPCSDTAGNPAVIEEEQPDLQMVISNIKWGEIGSTY